MDIVFDARSDEVGAFHRPFLTAVLHARIRLVVGKFGHSNRVDKVNAVAVVERNPKCFSWLGLYVEVPHSTCGITVQEEYKMLACRQRHCLVVGYAAHQGDTFGHSNVLKNLAVRGNVHATHIVGGEGDIG